MTNFWNIIIETNTFNFVILAIIIAIVWVKLDINKVFQTLKENISNAIENAKTSKLDADRELKKAKKLFKNIQNEITEQEQQAQKTANAMVNSITKNLEEQLNSIEKNINLAIQNEEKEYSLNLTHETTDKAIKIAEQKIINMLNDNPQLHEKLIQESINELSKVKL